MKKQILFVLGIALLASACNDDPMIDDSSEEIASGEITTEIELATVEDLIQDTETEVDLQLALRSDSSNISRCATITRVPEEGFPATITIAFGAGCEGPNGRVRAGQILVRQTDSLHLAGAERLLTFNDFSVDRVQISGTRLLTNQGTNDLGQPVWDREVMNAEVIFPDGSMLTWNSRYRRTQIRGFDTRIKIDDVFRIVGTTEGVDRNDIAYRLVISEPMINSRDCRWIQAGQLEVTRGDAMRTVDFGNGFCDPIATITAPNGQSRRIRLDNKWWQGVNG
jgi:hypothetical protein